MHTLSKGTRPLSMNDKDLTETCHHSIVDEFPEGNLRLIDHHATDIYFTADRLCLLKKALGRTLAAPTYILHL